MSKNRKTHLRDFDPYGPTKYHQTAFGFCLSIVLGLVVCFYASVKFLEGGNSLSNFKIRMSDSENRIDQTQLMISLV